MQVIEALVRIAEDAGAAIQRARTEGLAIDSKHRGEIVTSADHASHELMMERLTREFPGLAMLTEESSEHAIPSKPFLLVDELDGTAPFAAGSQDWGVMIALMDGGPVLGVIHLPDRDMTISASQGQGCRLNGYTVRLEAERQLSQVLAGVEINPQMQPEDWELLKIVAASTRTVRCTACTAASAYELLAQTTGFYLNLRGARIWDFAVPALAITEAGGAVCSPDGARLGWRQLEMSLAASAHPALMQEWLLACRQAGLGR